MHPVAPPPSTHVVQGRLPSHRWRGKVSPRSLGPTMNVQPLTDFLRLTAGDGRCSCQFHVRSSEDYSRRLTDRGRTLGPCVGYFQHPSSLNHTHSLRSPFSHI